MTMILQTMMIFNYPTWQNYEYAIATAWSASPYTFQEYLQLDKIDLYDGDGSHNNFLFVTIASKVILSIACCRGGCVQRVCCHNRWAIQY